MPALVRPFLLACLLFGCVSADTLKMGIAEPDDDDPPMQGELNKDAVSRERRDILIDMLTSELKRRAKQNEAVDVNRDVEVSSDDHRGPERTIHDERRLQMENYPNDEKSPGDVLSRG